MRLAYLTLIGILAWALPAQARSPVIVELYTSQGCGACAEAGKVIDQLAARDDLLALTFSVDYWDYLGWSDTFARPEFAERQRSYAAQWPRQAIFTPQVVVGGRGQTRADKTPEIERIVRRARVPDGAGPAIRLRPGRVTVEAATTPLAHSADSWRIRYDPAPQDVEVKRGENAGRTLTYRNVVRELINVGQWNGRRATYPLPAAKRDGLTSVVIVQKAGGGQVLAVSGD